MEAGHREAGFCAKPFHADELNPGEVVWVHPEVYQGWGSWMGHFLPRIGDWRLCLAASKMPLMDIPGMP